MSKRYDIDCRKCIYRIRDSRITTKGKPYIDEKMSNAYYCLVMGRLRLFKRKDCYVFIEGNQKTSNLLFTS